MARIKYSPGVMRFISASGETIDVVIGPYDQRIADNDFTLRSDVHVAIEDAFVRARVGVGQQYVREFEKLDDPNISDSSESAYTYSGRIYFPEAGGVSLFQEDAGEEAAGVGSGWLGAPLGQETTEGSQPFVVSEWTIYGSPYNCEGGNIKVSDGEPRPPPPDYSIEQPPAVAPPIPIIIRDLPDFTDVPLYSNIVISVDVSPCSIQWYEVGVGPLSLQGSHPAKEKRYETE